MKELHLNVQNVLEVETSSSWWDYLAELSLFWPSKVVPSDPLSHSPREASHVSAPNPSVPTKPETHNNGLLFSSPGRDRAEADNNPDSKFFCNPLMKPRGFCIPLFEEGDFHTHANRS
jgi:hypothetical protein